MITLTSLRIGLGVSKEEQPAGANRVKARRVARVVLLRLISFS